MSYHAASRCNYTVRDHSYSQRDHYYSQRDHYYSQRDHYYSQKITTTRCVTTLKSAVLTCFAAEDPNHA
jgi:hypothetical protein